MRAGLLAAYNAAKEKGVPNIGIVVPAFRHADTTPLRYSPLSSMLPKMRKGQTHREGEIIYRLESAKNIGSKPYRQVLLVVSARAEQMERILSVSDVAEIVVMPYTPEDAMAWARI
jgi:hypothetical protein